MLKLKEKEYSPLLNVQENDNEICDYLASMSYKSDSIRDLFDIVTNCFKEKINGDLFSIGFSLYAGGYTEEAIDYGLCDGKDIIEHLETAHILYIQNLLRDNLEAIIQNYAIKYINSNNFEITEDEFEDIDLSEMDESCSFYDVERIIDEFIENKANDLLEGIKDELILSIKDKILILKEEKSKLIETNDLDYSDDIFELTEKMDYFEDVIDDLYGVDIYYLDLTVDNFKNTNIKETIKVALNKQFSDL